MLLSEDLTLWRSPSRLKARRRPALRKTI
jgi:hypothetical protein